MDDSIKKLYPIRLDVIDALICFLDMGYSAERFSGELSAIKPSREEVKELHKMRNMPEACTLACKEYLKVKTGDYFLQKTSIKTSKCQECGRVFP
ncbi:MAG: hypothetical protein AAB875_06760, partial [Patescibacteria group bacterium]